MRALIYIIHTHMCTHMCMCTHTCMCTRMLTIHQQAIHSTSTYRPAYTYTYTFINAHAHTSPKRMPPDVVIVVSIWCGHTVLTSLPGSCWASTVGFAAAGAGVSRVQISPSLVCTSRVDIWQSKEIQIICFDCGITLTCIVPKVE